MTGPKRAGGPRSNAYSKSRFTNWARFNPFDSEAKSVSRQKLPYAAFEPPASGASVSIHVLPLHPDFVRPCEPEAVAMVLSRVPTVFQERLRAVWLLGGNGKQSRAAFGPLFHYGCYDGESIYLHAFPRRLLRSTSRRLPKPSVMQEYERAGATLVKSSQGWELSFDTISLRSFYLYDVLLHEIGHHVDSRVFARDNRSAERYANWFARTVAKLRSEDFVAGVSQ